MSSPESTSPEVIQFEGVFADIPDMHDLLAGENSIEKFSSTEDQKSRTVHWMHNTKQPFMHNFYVLDPVARLEAPHNVYNLVVNDLSDYAHLYIFRGLGNVSFSGDMAKHAAPANFDQLQNEWAGFQIAAGLVLPNSEDIANFEQIFKDFYVRGR